MNHESTLSIRSQSCVGVTFRIFRISFGRRLELIRKIRDLAAAIEFLESGSDPKEKFEAALLAQKIEQAYLEVGLHSIEGLTIDGYAADPILLVENGPDALCREIIDCIKAEMGLSPEQEKN